MLGAAMAARSRTSSLVVFTRSSIGTLVAGSGPRVAADDLRVEQARKRGPREVGEQEQARGEAHTRERDDGRGDRNPERGHLDAGCLRPTGPEEQDRPAEVEGELDDEGRLGAVGARLPNGARVL